MNRTNLTDRAVVLLAGLALAAAGLLVLDWHTGTVLDLRERLSTSGLQDVLGSAWWPWVSALAGVVLGLLGLAWLLAHVPGRGPARARLSGSDQSGRLEVDLRAVSSSIAERLEELGPLTSAHGGAARVSGRDVLQVDARVEPGADPAAVAQAVRQCAAEVDEAFAGEVALRVLLDAPRRSRSTDDRVRVQ